MPPRICLKNVIHNYRVIRERPDSLREAFTKIFRGGSQVKVFTAVNNVSADVYDGEALALIGRNGSGKSTLLKIIAGVYKPSAGTARIEGQVAPLIELGAGFHNDLTGRENIVLNGLLLGLSRNAILEREDRIVQFAGLGEFIDSPVKQYSSGMFMRLAFAIAIEADPDILLIDEVLAVGDAEFQLKCAARIDEFRRRGKTMILVTHDMTAVRRLCSRVVLLDHGQVIADSTPDVGLASYEELLQPMV